MRKKRFKDEEFSPEDRAALNQGRALRRKQRVIRDVWVRALAALLCDKPKRFVGLMDQIREIVNKEMRREGKSKTILRARDSGK